MHVKGPCYNRLARGFLVRCKFQATQAGMYRVRAHVNACSSVGYDGERRQCARMLLFAITMDDAHVYRQKEAAACVFPRAAATAAAAATVPHGN